MSEEKNPDNDWRWFLVALIGFVTFITIVLTLSSLNGIAQKDYESKLTPEERQELKEERAIEEQVRIENNQKAMKGLIDFAYYPIPLGLFIIGSVIWLLLNPTPRRW